VRVEATATRQALDPTLYDLDPEPYGPFPRSKRLTEAGDVRLVPIPGHSIGQVGVVVETDREALFFSGDHVLRQDWFVEDYRAGNLRGIATFPHIRLAPETSRRIRRFAEDTPTVLMPAHDPEALARLAARETLRF
jgi:N-acyl homoserine lactone hydrolase